MNSDALVNDALRALAALEKYAEAVSPGVTEEDDAYPAGDAGMAGLSLLYHMMRTGCGLEDAVQHLEGHCRVLDELQSEARKEPLRLPLEEIELATANHFPPPQVAMNALNYAIARVSQGLDAYLGDHGGMELASGRELQRQQTKRRRQTLAAGFFALRQQHPRQYPLTDEGNRDAADVLGCTENQLREALKDLREFNPLMKAAWKYGFPAPPHKK